MSPNTIFLHCFDNTQTEQNLKFGHRRALELLKNVETCYLTEALLNCTTNKLLLAVTLDNAIHAWLLNITLKILQTQNHTPIKKTRGSRAKIKIYINGLDSLVATLKLINIISWSI